MPIIDASKFAPGLRARRDAAGSDAAFYSDEATHGALADYFAENGDPRETLLRDHPGDEVHITSRARIRSTGRLSSNLPTHRATVPVADGLMHYRRYAGPKGTHWAVGWTPDPKSGAPGYWKHMPHEEFKTFFRSLPKDHTREVKKTLIDPNYHSGNRPKLRFAAERQPGVAAGVREATSANHEARANIAKEILREAGLDPSVVRRALVHEGDRAVPAVVQVIQRKVDPARIRYAAAWYGLLSNSPAVTVFHPSDNGSDSLHVISSPHPAEHIAAYLRRSGVPKFTTESHGAGTRAYVYDPGSKMSLDNILGGLDARVVSLPGVGFKLGVDRGQGAGPAVGATAGTADARASYRNTISDYEGSGPS